MCLNLYNLYTYTTYSCYTGSVYLQPTVVMLCQVLFGFSPGDAAGTAATIPPDPGRFLAPRGEKRKVKIGMLRSLSLAPVPDRMILSSGAVLVFEGVN
jgi:hypothetical protein